MNSPNEERNYDDYYNLTHHHFTMAPMTSVLASVHGVVVRSLFTFLPVQPIPIVNNNNNHLPAPSEKCKNDDDDDNDDDHVITMTMVKMMKMMVTMITTTAMIKR